MNWKDAAVDYIEDDFMSTATFKQLAQNYWNITPMDQRKKEHIKDFKDLWSIFGSDDLIKSYEYTDWMQIVMGTYAIKYMPR